MPLFPVFDLSYFIVSILYLKYEPGEPAGVLKRAGVTGRETAGNPGVWRRGKAWIVRKQSQGVGSGTPAGSGIVGQAEGTDVSEGKERTLGIVGLGEEKQMQERNVIGLEEWGTGAGGDVRERSGILAAEGPHELGRGARSW